MIVAENVSRSYDVPGGPARCVLRQVDLVVNRREVVVLSGPSGAGKSTLLALLGGMDLPTTGRVTIDGQCTTSCSDIRLSEIRRKIGYLFQDSPMLPSLTVLGNVVQPLIPSGVSRTDRVAAGRRALELVGLPGVEDAWPGQLSGGERQRVALARALVSHPEVLIADEPTSQLDPKASEHVVDLLRRLREDGVAVIIASHDLNAWASADRFLRLEAGRLVERE